MQSVAKYSVAFGLAAFIWKTLKVLYPESAVNETAGVQTLLKLHFYELL